MKKANWKDIAELIGIASIVASLVFVGLEMRQTRKIALADGQITAAAAKMAHQAIFADNIDIWIRGKAGEALDEKDAAVFERLVIAANDMAFAGMSFAGIHAEEVESEFAVHDFAAFLFENPGARRVWSAREANLDKFRKFLSDEGNVYSYWPAAIHRDLVKLDEIHASLRGSSR